MTRTASRRPFSRAGASAPFKACGMKPGQLTTIVNETLVLNFIVSESNPIEHQLCFSRRTRSAIDRITEWSHRGSTALRSELSIREREYCSKAITDNNSTAEAQTGRIVGIRNQLTPKDTPSFHFQGTEVRVGLRRISTLGANHLFSS